MASTFYHSGEIGDILYSLKALSRVPRAHLYLNVGLELSIQDLIFVHPNKQFTYRDFLFIKKLLDRQPYIENAIYGTPKHIEFNLNFFRHSIFNKTELNFGDLYVDVCVFKVNKEDAHVPWLYCDVKKEYPITAIRVNRRTNDNFPWRKIVDKYKNDIIFLGTKSEYLEFVQLTGKMVAWKDYNDLYSICEVINGAKLHIGNSTSITVCAEGLKKPILFETTDTITDIRRNTQQFYRDSRLNVDTDMKDEDLIMDHIAKFV